MIYKMEEIHKVLPSILLDDVIVFPTDTVYGIGASIHSDCAIKKIFEIKNRPSEKSLIVLCANISQIEDIVGTLPFAVASLVKYLMPGGLTLILETNLKMSDEITRGKKTIGVRIPDHQIALAVIEKLGPLATTSANVSGKASPTVIDESNPVVMKADFVFDGGATKEQIPSTILDCTVNPPVILRPGAISEEKINEVMYKK